MSQWHGYILINETGAGWTNPQRVIIRDSARLLGDQTNQQPAKRNHMRIRSDNKAMIVEAQFDTDTITRAAVGQFLANRLGVSLATVNARLDYTIFGTISATWQQSRDAAAAYIAANSAEWEPTE